MLLGLYKTFSPVNAVHMLTPRHVEQRLYNKLCQSQAAIVLRGCAQDTCTPSVARSSGLWLGGEFRNPGRRPEGSSVEQTNDHFIKRSCVLVAYDAGLEHQREVRQTDPRGAGTTAIVLRMRLASRGSAPDTWQIDVVSLEVVRRSSFRLLRRSQSCKRRWWSRQASWHASRSLYSRARCATLYQSRASRDGRCACKARQLLDSTLDSLCRPMAKRCNRCSALPRRCARRDSCRAAR